MQRAGLVIKLLLGSLINELAKGCGLSCCYIATVKALMHLQDNSNIIINTHTLTVEWELELLGLYTLSGAS